MHILVGLLPPGGSAGCVRAAESMHRAGTVELIRQECRAVLKRRRRDHRACLPFPKVVPPLDMSYGEESGHWMRGVF
jgi:hypothetical protein